MFCAFEILNQQCTRRFGPAKNPVNRCRNSSQTLAFIKVIELDLGFERDVAATSSGSWLFRNNRAISSTISASASRDTPGPYLAEYAAWRAYVGRSFMGNLSSHRAACRFCRQEWNAEPRPTEVGKDRGGPQPCLVTRSSCHFRLHCKSPRLETVSLGKVVWIASGGFVWAAYMVIS